MPTNDPSTSRRTVLKTLGVAAAGIAGTAGATTAQTQNGQLEPTTIASFEPPRLPENIGVGNDGTHYMSMAPIGEIWGLSPDADDVSPSSVASLPVPSDNPDATLLGISDVTDEGAVYACANTRQQDTNGVWHVPLEDGGEPTQVASMDPEENTINGITTEADGHDALVTGHQQGLIWSVSRDQGAEVWVDDPLLDPNPYADIPVGVDGIAIGPNGDVWVDNLSFGSLLRIPVQPDGSAGDIEVFMQSDELVGSDGMTVDSAGNIYVAVNVQNKVVRVTQEGEITTLVSGGDLDFPSDVHFGAGEEEQTLYFTNFALLAAQAEDQQANPSYMSIDLGAAEVTPAETPTETPVENMTETPTETPVENATEVMNGTPTETEME